jgi:RNA polymerase sigma factor (sigma-70 family)
VSAAPSIDPAGQVAPAPPVLGADAAHALFERHAGAIYGYCLKRLGGREEAEDAVQTTFLNAFRALRRGVVPEFEAAWLYKIAENVCRERNRSARRRLEVVRDPTVIEEAAPAATQTGRDELYGLDDALGRMAPRQRHALLLREWKGLSYREIAQELRLSPAAVETLLFRARRSLARNLQVGSLVPWLKSLLSGSAAVKAAAAAGVVVASASLGGGEPVKSEARPAPRQPAVGVPATSVTRATPPGNLVAPQVSEMPARNRVTPSGRGGAPERRSAPRRASLPVTTPAPGAPAPAREEAGSSEPSSPASPPAPSSPSAPPPSPPASPLPTPPASLAIEIPPPPPTPQLPALPGLPALPPPPPPLPPAPQLPAPQLPATSELPALPQLLPLPQLL